MRFGDFVNQSMGAKHSNQACHFRRLAAARVGRCNLLQNFQPLVTQKTQKHTGGQKSDSDFPSDSLWLLVFFVANLIV
jgi:hypothetical protein